MEAVQAEAPAQEETAADMSAEEEAAPQQEVVDPPVQEEVVVEIPRTAIQVAFDTLIIRQQETADAYDGAEGLNADIVEAESALAEMKEKAAVSAEAIAAAEAREQSAATALQDAIAAKYPQD